MIRWHLDWVHPARHLVEAKGWQRKRQTWQGHLVHTCAGQSLQCQLEESEVGRTKDYYIDPYRFFLCHNCAVYICNTTCFLASSCCVCQIVGSPRQLLEFPRYSFPRVSSRRGFFFRGGRFRQMFLIVLVTFFSFKFLKIP